MTSALIAALLLLTACGGPESVRGDEMTRAIEAGSEGDVRELLDDGWPVDRLNEFGQAPLYVAASSSTPPIAEALLNAGADVNTRLESEGWTALMGASRRTDGQGAPMVALLIAAGADPCLRSTDWVRDFPPGSTAMDIAQNVGDPLVLEEFDGISCPPA